MIVWGGNEAHWSSLQQDHLLNDGATYDPKDGTWLKTRDPNDFQEGPFRGRRNHVAVWTGKEMIIWGGRGEDYEQLSDGSRYVPGDRVTNIGNQWFPMAPPPFPAPETVEGVWTGSELVLVMGMSRDPSTNELVTVAAAYNNQADTWRMLPTPPLPTTYGAKLLSIGGTVALVRTTGFGRSPSPPQPLVELFDTRSERWSVVQDFQLDIETQLDAVSAGRHLLVFVGFTRTPDATSVAINVDSEAVRPIRKAPPDVALANPVWSGKEVLFWPQKDGAAYNPETDQWRELPAPPRTHNDFAVQGVWADDKVIAWGSDSATIPSKTPSEPSEQRPSDVGATYTPALDRGR
jgi:hypothetical protein